LDLHLTAAHATTEEKTAVDAELGFRTTGGTACPTRRDMLLPVLHAIQARAGWISPGALNYVSVRLDVAPAEAHGVASFYSMFSLRPRDAVVAHVCDDIGCLVRGAEKLCAELEKNLGPQGSGWVRSPCLGLCERAPAALVSAAGETPREAVLAPAESEALIALVRDAAEGRLPAEPDVLNPQLSLPQAGQPQLRLLRRVSKVDPSNLDDYRRLGGYEALHRALDLGPEGIVREVIESRLLGRGGAAFPTGKKWEAVASQRHLGRTHYVVCNADESEPGTFKDRIVMEGDPFAILEGMTIAALAVGAQRGYIYIRGEYPLATRRLVRAIDAARAGGMLGDNILGRGLRFDIELRRGAGAYICGEETALFNSIEGYRGEPRNKPPFPTQAGLFRQPTVVNNVETLINIPEIILGGGAAYARIGIGNSAGYRLFCLSGHVVRPGVYEVPFGATLRNMIDLAGGVGGNGRLQAVLLGGAAGAFVSPQELDTPLTFEGTRAIGATLGSGVIMLFDDTVNLKLILLRIAAFFRHETCGQCVPCRVGSVRQEEALERLIQGRPLGSIADEIHTLREMGQAMRDASICGLGQTASSVLESALHRWSLFT
jgi:NADH-quinone oxidoreductase subunit F